MSGLKLKVLPQFPAQLLGGVGIEVTKANGNYSIDLDYSELPPVNTLPPSNQFGVVYDKAHDSYVLAPLSLIGQGGGGPVTQYKKVTVSRNLTLAAGNQSVTGVGFQPQLILFVAGIVGGGQWGSVGACDAIGSNSCVELSVSLPAIYMQPSIAGAVRQDTSNYQYFNVASFDPDGFTLAWVKTGNPNLTATVFAICFK